MKLVVGATTVVTTEPTVERFFYKAASTTGPDTLVIDAADFWTDTGADATELPALTANNSYINVYINGVLQMDDLVDYVAGASGTGQLSITIPADTEILEDTPIVLVVTNFAPTGSTTINT